MDRHVIAAIAERFPEARHEIEKLADSDVEFCTLCEDFALARSAMVTAAAGNADTDRARGDEYRALHAELAAAITETVRRARAAGGHDRQ